VKKRKRGVKGDEKKEKNIPRHEWKNWANEQKEECKGCGLEMSKKNLKNHE
jgi:hypothetical protein